MGEAMAKPTAEDLFILAEAIEMLAYWLAVDYATYNADELGRRLEALGVLTSDKWELPQWLKEAAAQAREAFDRIGPESEETTNRRLENARDLLGKLRSQAKSTQEKKGPRW